jgi:hypothetical protein
MVTSPTGDPATAFAAAFLVHLLSLHAPSHQQRAFTLMRAAGSGAAPRPARHQGSHRLQAQRRLQRQGAPSFPPSANSPSHLLCAIKTNFISQAKVIYAPPWRRVRPLFSISPSSRDTLQCALARLYLLWQRSALYGSLVLPYSTGSLEGRAHLRRRNASRPESRHPLLRPQ